MNFEIEKIMKGSETVQDFVQKLRLSSLSSTSKLRLIAKFCEKHKNDVDEDGIQVVLDLLKYKSIKNLLKNAKSADRSVIYKLCLDEANEASYPLLLKSFPLVFGEDFSQHINNVLYLNWRMLLSFVREVKENPKRYSKCHLAIPVLKRDGDAFRGMNPDFGTVLMTLTEQRITSELLWDFFLHRTAEEGKQRYMEKIWRASKNQHIPPIKTRMDTEMIKDDKFRQFITHQGYDKLYLRENFFPSSADVAWPLTNKMML